MRKISGASGILALLMFPTIALAAPSISVKSAVSANKTAGAKVFAGDPIKTNKGGVVSADFIWGGVKSISILPSSSLNLAVYGNGVKGSRFTQLDVVGEVLVEVLTVNPATEVKVCFRNRWGRLGCSRLKSSVRIAPTADGGQLVAVIEGNVLAESEGGAFVQIVSGQYSILGKDGKFSPAASVLRNTGYTIGLGRSKTIGVFRALPGWRFCDGSMVTTSAIGARICVLSPLVKDGGFR
jgi:hypothetical protein